MSTSTSTRGQETKRRLLDAACAVFAEKGFLQATVREICEGAKANVAAVNYHFGDKSRLYREAIKHAHGLKVLQRPMAWPDGTPAEQKLRGFVHKLLERMTTDAGSPHHRRLMMREIARPTAASADVVREYIRPDFAVLLGILDELLPPEVPMPRRHLLAFSLVGQCLYYKVARPIIPLLIGEDAETTCATERVADHIAGVTLAALSAEGATP